MKEKQLRELVRSLKSNKEKLYSDVIDDYVLEMNNSYFTLAFWLIDEPCKWFTLKIQHKFKVQAFDLGLLKAIDIYIYVAEYLDRINFYLER
jgi:hypothetical protein